MGAQIDDFCSLMELEGHGPDVYVGLSPDYPWGRVYGGQVVAQALRAAASTVEEERRVHSLHAYFIRGGTSDEPIRYEVDRLRNGRSFTTRRVVARQSDGAILNLSCSFQKDEEQVDIQESSLPDDAGNPDDYESENWAPLLERRPTNSNWSSASGRAATWLKVHGPIPDDPILQACALAFASDDVPTEAVSTSHPKMTEVRDGWSGYADLFIGASLDHAIWFHRSARADEWQFHDFRSHGLNGGRGLSTGEIFTSDGLHVATVAQEALLRERTR